MAPTRPEGLSIGEYYERKSRYTTRLEELKSTMPPATRAEEGMHARFQL